MATIPSGTKFLGVDPSFTDLTERKGSKIDRKSEYFTIADIAEEIGPGPTGPQGVQGPQGPQGAGATQTLQQTVNLGSTITNGSVTSTLSATNFKIAATASSGMTINSSQIVYKNSSNELIIKFPNTLTSGPEVTQFRELSGTVALLEDFALTNNTTSALSLAALNSQYPNDFYYAGFRVFCPNITGGGLVYSKTGASTWVSQTITAVS